jgi:hypothetical protein
MMIGAIIQTQLVALLMILTYALKKCATCVVLSEINRISLAAPFVESLFILTACN